MTQPTSRINSHSMVLQRAPTGIQGLDEILNGGIPAGRPTLVCGGPGCGKTLLAMEFLARGAKQYNEPGVYMTFEETAKELSQNFASLDIDLNQLSADNKISIDYVHVERNEIEETGEYDLEGLFIRLDDAIDTIGAKRVVLDTIESLFSGFSDEAILRSELRRLFRYLKDKGVTAVITGERGQGQLTRHGLEEYVSDCVILLDHRVMNGIASRYLRVVKYRGSKHGHDEYPFLIGDFGISVLPITSLGLDYPVSNEYISSGIPRLDTMLGDKGFFVGSTVLVSGTAGSGKTSIAAHFAAATCQRGERCLYFAFEEPASQIIRNMRSIGLDLQPWVDQGLLRFHAVRPSTYGLETHLLTIQQMLREFEPSVVVIDPITNLVSSMGQSEIKSMFVRLIDFLKMNYITGLFTSLTTGGMNETSSEVNVSSLVDTWLLVRNLESNGEHIRGIYVLKSRGMSHSNQVREFHLTERGLELLDVYLGTDGVQTGSDRIASETRAKIEAEKQKLETARKKRELGRKQAEISNQIASLQASLDAAQDELFYIENVDELRKQMTQNFETDLAQYRYADDDDEADDNHKPEKGDQL